MIALLLLAAVSPPPADLALVGMILSADPARSVAILRADGRTRLAGPGEAAFGGRVRAVGPESVLLEFGPESVELRLAAAAPPAKPPVPPPDPEPAEDLASPARTMERRAVERRLGQEIPRILAETVVVPVTDQGRVAGLALTRIPDGTLLTEAGLRPGDVLTSLNDTPIDGLPALIGLWPRLQSERELRAIVLRNGRPVSLTVTLR